MECEGTESSVLKPFEQLSMSDRNPKADKGWSIQAYVQCQKDCIKKFMS